SSGADGNPRARLCHTVRRSCLSGGLGRARLRCHTFESLTMIGFPAPRMIKTNGIDIAGYEAGPEDGIPGGRWHGFPELAYSWRHQIPALAQAGYRVIAPDQRGYGGTSRPESVTDYDITHLTGDLVGLLDALGLKDTIFCGHDWGGIVVWNMSLLHPE